MRPKYFLNIWSCLGSDFNLLTVIFHFRPHIYRFREGVLMAVLISNGFNLFNRVIQNFLLMIFNLLFITLATIISAFVITLATKAKSLPLPFKN